MKIVKRVTLGILALAFVLTMTIAGYLFSVKNAIAAPYVPAEQLGLTEVSFKSFTLTQGVSGEGEEIEYIDIDGYSNTDLYTLIEFSGSDIPMIAFNATRAYSTWNAEDYNTTGYVFSGMYETETFDGYSNDNLRFSKGFLTNNANCVTRQSWGGFLRDDNVDYVMIVGIRRVNTWYRYPEIYLYQKTATGTLQEVLVNKVSSDYTNTAATGSHIVFYPQMGGNDITFKYATPKTTIKDILNSLGDNVSYKQDLSEKFTLGDTALTTAKMTKVPQGLNSDFENVDYISFDDYADKSAFLLFDFVGKNMPNFAVRAQNAYSTWPAANGENAVSTPDAGFFVSHSGRNSSIYGNNILSQQLLVFTGLTGGSFPVASGEDGKGCGLNYFTDNVHYILLIGYTYINGNTDDTITYHLFSESSGQLSLVNSFVVSPKCWGGGTGTKVVIYPNAGYGPDTINFKYSAPQPSIKELIEQLPGNYTYKSQIQKELLGNKIDIVSEAGESLSAEYTKETTYTLPEYSKAGVIGYDIDGKLYASGDVFTIEGDVTATEVELNLVVGVGASVRATEKDGKYGGLRFKVTADADTVQKYSIELKGQIIPTDLINGSYDVGETGSKSVSLAQAETKDGINTYCLTLTEVLYTNYNRAFSALAYTTVTYQDGDEVVIASEYDANKHSRSVYDVAVNTINNMVANEYNPSQETILKTYVAYSINLVNTDGTISVANGQDGLVDNTIRKYAATQEGNVVTITLTDLPERLQQITHASITVFSGETRTRVLCSASVSGTTATVTYTIG